MKVFCELNNGRVKFFDKPRGSFGTQFEMAFHGIARKPILDMAIPFPTWSGHATELARKWVVDNLPRGWKLEWEYCS